MIGASNPLFFHICLPVIPGWFSRFFMSREVWDWFASGEDVPYATGWLPIMGHMLTASKYGKDVDMGLDVGSQFRSKGLLGSQLNQKPMPMDVYRFQ